MLEGLGPKDISGLETEFKDREIRFFIETNSRKREVNAANRSLTKRRTNNCSRLRISLVI